MQGTIITRPVTSSASSRLDSLSSEVMPSYSSPWLPPVSSAVGPSPFLTTVTGIITAPQAESSTEMGSLRKPCWTPSASKSTVALMGLGRLVIIENSLLCHSGSAHEELAREVGQGLAAGLGDQDALGDLQAPLVLPEARHEVEGHAGLQDGLVGGAQAHGALAPVRRVADADGVAAAGAAAVEAVLVHGRAQGHGDVRGAVAGPGHGQAVLDALEQRGLGAHELLGRPAQEHRSRHRRVVALVDPGDLEEGALPLPEGGVVPGQ